VSPVVLPVIASVLEALIAIMADPDALTFPATAGVRTQMMHRLPVTATVLLVTTVPVPSVLQITETDDGVLRNGGR